MDFDTTFFCIQKDYICLVAVKTLLQECLWHVPCVKSVEEVQHKIALEYRNKLMIEGENLSNPFQIHDGWIKEGDGISLCFSRIFSPQSLS